MPIPVIATRSSNFSVVRIGRTCRRVSSGSTASGGSSGAGVSPVGRNNGNQVPPSSANSTATGIPTNTSSGATPTTLVVQKTRGSSSSATEATT